MELRRLERLAKLEHPLSYITDKWEIFDLESGKLLQAFPKSESQIVVVLDGDHFLATNGVYSISQKKKVQEVEEIHDFFGEENWKFEVLPAPERYEYTTDSGGA